MSRWAKLFAELYTPMPDGDTSRHFSAQQPLDLQKCHRVSPSGIGVNNTGAPSNSGLTQPALREWGRGPAAAVVPTWAPMTNGDMSRHEVFVACDFETRNTAGCNLNTAGASRYAADPATEILTLVYRCAGEEQLWMPALGCAGPLKTFAEDPGLEFVCFAGFELAIWREIMVARFGFAPIPTARWIDAQAVCSYLALPRTLGKVLPVLGVPVVKDAAGQRLVRGLSRPGKKTGLYPELTPKILDRVHQYNRVDVDALIAIHTATGRLPERERQVWELDQQINARGIGIDIEMVRAAKIIADSTTGAVLAEFAELTGGLSPYQVAKTREWLSGRGYGLPDLQEMTVTAALEDSVLPEDVRRVLEIRSITASTSLKKLDAMIACTGAGGRARGLLQYHAATPGRWSAVLLQPQNLPRPTVEIKPEEIESVVAAIKTADPDSLRPWGPPLEVLASSLRFVLAAAEGKQFGAGDYSMIETCILLALAGQRDKVELIASGVDVYRDMAATIYRLDREYFLGLDEAELSLEQSAQRQIGKGTVLGCGYGMGPPRFRHQYLRHLSVAEATKLSEQIVYTDYRKKWAPLVPKLWRDLEQTARRAMLRPGNTAVARCGLSYRLTTVADIPCLVCRLLNGKEIHYMHATVSADKTDRWGFPVWTYWAYRKGQWREIEPYGGQLTDHACQGLARELLVDALFRFEQRGYPVVLSAHDEVLTERENITAAMIEAIMAERSPWAVELGVPVKVKAWVGGRYRKQ